MYNKLRTLRWPLMAFLVIFLLFSINLSKDQFSSNKPLFSTAKETTKHVNEPVLKNIQLDELKEIYDFAITEPTLEWTEQDLKFFKSVAGETVFSQLALIPEANEKPDFVTITRAERLFKVLFMYFDALLSKNPTLHEDPRYKDSWQLYKRLEKTLYPWIYPYWENAFHINNQTEGKGLVFCVGDNQFKYAVASIRAIRDLFHCDLPIEIFYIRDNDLSLAKRTYLATEFTNVRLEKLEDYVSYYYTRFGGWAMKPFALLASRFTELIFIDSDAYFLQDPSLLFEDKGYLTTGTLFFYDRTLFPNWEKGPDWLRSFLPSMSSLVERTRWFKGLSSHEQESGVVVINKQKSLLGLLSTCKLNGITERDQVVYKHVHGDKETFWVGYEIMQTPYAFIKSFGAVIGNMGRGGDDGSPDTVCGVQLHLGTNNKPLWFNGGLYRNKNKQPPLEYLNFTHYAEGDDWEFATHCIRDKNKISRLDADQRAIALATIEFDIQRAKDEALINENKWTPHRKNQQ